MSLPETSNVISNQGSDQLLQLWREQRAYRVGRSLGMAGVVLSLIALFMDMHYSSPAIVYSDFILLGGCLFSLLWTRSKPRPYFCWWPLFFGFWMSTLPSLYWTGGIHSPFLGFYLALLIVCAVVVQTRISPMYFVFVIFLHIPALYILDGLYLIPKDLPAAPFTAVIDLVTLAAVLVCVKGLLRTETDLSREFAKRAHELGTAREELEREEAANLAKVTFLANVSHELRTPLAAIVGYSELLRHSEVDPAERDAYCDTIFRNGLQLSRLVDDLLDLSKVEAGKVEIFATRIVLRDVLSDVLAQVRLLAQRKNIPLSLAYRNSIPEFIFTDGVRFKQILLNMMTNAVKFTDRGQVELTLEHVDGQLKLEVRDTGRGISEEEQSRLFQPFSQGDPSLFRRYGGAGLGLSLSRRLARALSGDLELTKSCPGDGSVFTFTLPIGSIEQQEWQDQFEARATAIPQEVLRSSQGHRLFGLSILVVEDSEDNLQLMRLHLQGEGALVDSAGDGLAGVEKAMGGCFDIVLMDIQMPLLDGYEAVATLRRSGYERPILALTANARQEDRERCLKVGCDAHLSKPIHRAALIDAVASAAARYEVAEISH